MLEHDAKLDIGSKKSDKEKEICLEGTEKSSELNKADEGSFMRKDSELCF